MTETQRSPLDTRHIAVMGLVFLAFLVRLYRLDTQSIWWDEAISIHLAHSTVGEIVSNRTANLHPPMYFFLLKLWISLVGDSAFCVRFLSVWLSIPLIPGLYAFGKRWLTPRAGLISAALAAASPLYLAYAQETRVYAFLPLVYLALMALSFALSHASNRSGWTAWMVLGGIEALALGLHYMSLFAVVYIVARLFIRLRSDGANLRRLLATQGGVILLLTPWLLAVLRDFGAFSRRLQMSNWRAEPVTATHFARLLWTFQTTGLVSPIDDPLGVALTTLAAIALLGALVYLLSSSHLGDRSMMTVRLLLNWLIPLASAFVVWRIRPLSHPRYVILFTPALLLTSASVLDQLWDESFLQRTGAVLLAVFLLGASVLGICTYWVEFTKDDIQGVAGAIKARSAPGDLIVVPSEDWSIPYYYDGPARVEMVWPGDSPSDWQRFKELTKEAPTVFLVGYRRGIRDRRGILPFALEAAGSLVERWDSEGVYVEVYDLDRPVSQPRLVPAEARFGPLRLTGAWVEQKPAADTAVSVALRWRGEGAIDGRLRVGLDLEGSYGWVWSSADDWLLNEAAVPTDQWSVGQEAITYHILALPPGTPPLSYTLTARVYSERGQTVQPVNLLDRAGNPKGQSHSVGTASLDPPLVHQNDPYGQAERVPLWESPVELRGSLVLRGASLDRQAADPGQTVFVTLHWTKKAYVTPDLQATLSMEQGRKTLVKETRPIGGRYPPQRWASGQSVVEHYPLVIPADVEEGPAQVIIGVESRQVEVGEVEVSASEHRFTAPRMTHHLDIRFGDVAELVGYNLTQTEFAPEDPIRIVLYWRALDGADKADYKVFSHLLAADGHLVGQHDGRPGGGARPTRSWVPGEIIADPHIMVFRESYTGSARVEVGLYEASSMDRVTTTDGATFVLLPSGLTISRP